MTSDLSARVLDLEESPTLAVTAKAQALRAAGHDVISFGAGEPDFPTPDHVVEAAAKACHDPATHRYSPAAGQPELREAVADATRRDTGYDVDAAMVVVSNGGKHALYNIFQALLDPGDEVIVPAPYWVSYPEQVKLAGGAPVIVATTAASGFRATVDDLEAAATPRTKALLFVSPSNPTGAVYPPDQVTAVGTWAADRGIWVVADEIYQHLVYGAARFASLPVLVPEAAGRTVVVGGVSKTYAMTGWRVGWSIAPRQLTTAIAAVQSQATSNVANVCQVAALAALTGPQDGVAARRAAFDRRRRLAVDLLGRIDGVSCVEPEGAFYCFPSFEAALPGRAASTLHLAEQLLDQVQVAIVPGEAFGAPGFARISYALSDEDLQEGLTRIASLLQASGGEGGLS